MASIDERDLCVLIPLLAAKIQEVSAQLRASDGLEDSLGDAELDDRAELQEMLQQYHLILENLRVEYEAGALGASNLPSFSQLTEPFRLD